MADLGEQANVSGVYGGVEFRGNQEGNQVSTNEKILPAKKTFWSSFRAFWLQEIDWNKQIDLNREIKVELTPKQQKVEDEINEFLHQEITWEKVHDFLFQEVNFGK